MTIDEILIATSGTLLCGKKIKPIEQFVVDTRKLKKGYGFIALPTEKNDGHYYVEEALKKASVIIVSKDVSYKTKVPVIKVKDTYEALFDLARYQREKYGIFCIAVTGSNGKTTTKELIDEILSLRFHVLKTEGNYNNHIGVPLTCMKLNQEYDILLTELGMNHEGEISKLSQLVKPDIGIITNISSAHIGHMGSIQNIIKAKLEIEDGMNQGITLLNGRNHYLRKQKNKNRILIGKEYLKPKNIESTLEETVFDLTYKNQKYKISFPGPKMMLSNVLLAIMVGLFFDISLDEMIPVIQNFKMKEHRFQIIKKDAIIIDDTYNANYESLKQILYVLKKEKKNKIIILGDILELGIYEKKYHQKINRLLHLLKHKKVLLVGEGTKVIKGLHFKNNNEMIDYLKRMDIKNSIILVKGSRKMHLDEITNYLLSRTS